MYTASLRLSRHSAAISVEAKFISDADSLSFVVLTSGVCACDRFAILTTLIVLSWKAADAERGLAR